MDKSLSHVVNWYILVLVSHLINPFSIDQQNQPSNTEFIITYKKHTICGFIIHPGNVFQCRLLVLFIFELFSMNFSTFNICVPELLSKTVGILLGFGNISFTNQETFSTGPNSSLHPIDAGVFNNDTLLDIVVANYVSDIVGIFLSYGNGSFASQTTYSTGHKPLSVPVGDFNNDIFLDIVVANYGNNNLGVFLGYGNYTFSEMVIFQMEYGTHPFSVVVADFNSDRKLDFAVTNKDTDNLRVLLQTC